jgi:tetratricopeptide (TPR) repeat protein
MKYSVLSYILLFALCLPFGPASGKVDLDGIVRKGIAASESGDNKTAVMYFTKVIEHPVMKTAVDHSAHLRSLRARSYLLLGQFRKAIEDATQGILIRRASVLIGSDHMVFYYRGAARLQIGEIDLAIQDFDEALNINPQFFNALGDRAVAHMKRNDIEQAKMDMLAALDIEPDFFQANHGLGAIFVKKKEYRLAIKYLNSAIRIYPSFAPSYIARGQARYGLGLKKSGDRDFQKACELGFTPTDAAAGTLEDWQDNCTKTTDTQ